METIIHAPRAGTIAELCVSQGDFVAAGDELISLYE
jgi:biotin carboxyl carrier protein